MNEYEIVIVFKWFFFPTKVKSNINNELKIDTLSECVKKARSCISEVHLHTMMFNVHTDFCLFKGA